MLHSDTSLDHPAGGMLLAECGIDPAAVREVSQDDRAIRCPDRGAVYPAYGFASLSPDPALGSSPRDAAQAEPWDPASPFPPA